MVLHRDEPRPSWRSAAPAPSRTATRTCCSRRCSEPCRLHDFVQRVHRLLDRRRRSPSGGSGTGRRSPARAARASVDRGEDVLARQASAVLARHRLHADLRRDHELLAGEELLQEPPGHDLALAAVVDVGGVEERDAALDGPPDDRLRVGLRRAPTGRSRARRSSSSRGTRARRAARCVPRFTYFIARLLSRSTTHAHRSRTPRADAARQGGVKTARPGVGVASGPAPQHVARATTGA